MAYDKVVDSSVLDAGLKSIADAIREKAEISDSFAFPTGFAEAIAGISAGGSAYYLGSITPTEASPTLQITHNLNSEAKTVSFIIFAADTTRPTTDVHATLRWVRAILENNAFSADCVTYWGTYGPHDSAQKITQISLNEMTVGNSNASYGFGAGRTYIVVAWRYEDLT